MRSQNSSLTIVPQAATARARYRRAARIQLITSGNCVLTEIVLRRRGRNDKAGTNVSRRTLEREAGSDRSTAERRPGVRNAKGTQRGAARPRFTRSYSRPEERKRVTGSMTGTGCSLKDPAGHRIAQGRIANIDELHGSPQIVRCSFAVWGSATSRTVRGQINNQAPVGQ